MKVSKDNALKQKGDRRTRSSNPNLTLSNSAQLPTLERLNRVIEGMTLLGEVVQRHRIALHLSLECIANSLEVEVDWVKQLEAGLMERHEINEPTLCSLSQVLHVDYLPLKLLVNVRLTEDDLAEQFNFGEKLKEVNNEHTI